MDIRHNIPYSKGRLLLKEKKAFQDGTFVEMRMWNVPRTARTPEGVKYSLVYIDQGGRRVLGYDNAEGKGHHRHENEKETPMEFTSIDELMRNFLEEVERIRGTRYEN